MLENRMVVDSWWGESEYRVPTPDRERLRRIRLAEEAEEREEDEEDEHIV